MPCGNDDQFVPLQLVPSTIVIIVAPKKSQSQKPRTYMPKWLPREWRFYQGSAALIITKVKEEEKKNIPVTKKGFEIVREIAFWCLAVGKRGPSPTDSGQVGTEMEPGVLYECFALGAPGAPSRPPDP